MTIIQCPSCDTKYRLKFEIAEGQQVRCPGCRHVWRFFPPQPEPDALLLSESLAHAFPRESGDETPPSPRPQAGAASQSASLSSPVLPRQPQAAAAAAVASVAAAPLASTLSTGEDESPFWGESRPIKAPEIPEWARKPSPSYAFREQAETESRDEEEGENDARSSASDDWEDQDGGEDDRLETAAESYDADGTPGGYYGNAADDGAYSGEDEAQYREASGGFGEDAAQRYQETDPLGDYAERGYGAEATPSYDGAGEPNGYAATQPQTARGQSWISELAEVMTRREEQGDFDYHRERAAAAGTGADYTYDDAPESRADGMDYDPEDTSGSQDDGGVSDMARLEDAERMDQFWRTGAAEEAAQAAAFAAGPATAMAPDRTRPDDDDSDISLDPAYTGYGDPGIAPERRFGSLTAIAAWGLYITFIAGLAGGIVGFRDHIVHILPGAAHYYAQAGLPVAGAALTFENVTYSWSERDGRPLIEVRGEVRNITGVSVTVPLLNIVVKDDQSIEVASTAATVVREPLAGGTAAPFTLEFLAPPSRVSEIELTFAQAQPG